MRIKEIASSIVFHAMYFWDDGTKQGEIDGTRSSRGEIMAYTILDRRSEEQRPLAKPRHSWENNKKVNLKETECEVMD